MILVGNKLDLCDENSGLFKKAKTLEKGVLSNHKVSIQLVSSQRLE